MSAALQLITIKFTRESTWAGQLGRASENSAKHKLYSEIKPITLNQALKEETPNLQRKDHFFKELLWHCSSKVGRRGNTAFSIVHLFIQVIFIREKSSGRLIIDGLRVLEESLPPTGATWKIKGPIYLGGVAPGKAVKNVQVSQT